MRKVLFALVTVVTVTMQAKDYLLPSPDGQLKIAVHAGNNLLTWEVIHDQTQVLTPSEI